MKVELTLDAEQRVQAELAAGRFPTAEDAVRHAISRAKCTAFVSSSLECHHDIDH